MDKLRTQMIAEYLAAHGRCSFAELRDRFGVSNATVHRDAAELARRDAVAVVRGGLVWREGATPTDRADPFADRVVANRRGKAAAARKALGTIVEGDIVFLDSSTTVFELALLLRNAAFTHLTIITNSLSVMQNFRKFPPQWVLIGLGGNYDAQLNSTLGAVTLNELKNLNLTKAYISAFGLDGRHATTNHERQAELLRAVLSTAEHTYLVIDRSKMGRTGLYRLASRTAFTKVFSG